MPKLTFGLGVVLRRRRQIRDKRGGADQPRKVDVRLPGKGNSNSHFARSVHLIITMLEWIRTSRLSLKNSLSLCIPMPSSQFRWGPPPGARRRQEVRPDPILAHRGEGPCAPPCDGTHRVRRRRATNRVLEVVQTEASRPVSLGPHPPVGSQLTALRFWSKALKKMNREKNENRPLLRPEEIRPIAVVPLSN